MACEVPVVASRVGGLPEVIEHGENGFLHPLDDLDGMARSARSALTGTSRSDAAWASPPPGRRTNASARTRSSPSTNGFTKRFSPVSPGRAPTRDSNGRSGSTATIHNGLRDTPSCLTSSAASRWLAASSPPGRWSRRPDARRPARRRAGARRAGPRAAAPGQHRHLHAGHRASRRREQRAAGDAESRPGLPHGAGDGDARQRRAERDRPGDSSRRSASCGPASSPRCTASTAPSSTSRARSTSATRSASTRRSRSGAATRSPPTTCG